MENMKEKLNLSINHEYTFRNKIGDLVSMMNDNELDELHEGLEVATKEELFDLIKVYHKEVKRLKLDIKEIIENE
jgi:hypothetical protein